MPMRFTLRMIPFALAICASGCSGIGENDAATNADLRTLAGPEISRLLTGNTVADEEIQGMTTADQEPWASAVAAMLIATKRLLTSLTLLAAPNGPK